jgi:2-haloacid dehalogenase
MSSSPSNARAVVFDLGGVLIDWNPRYLYRKLFPDNEPGMEEFLATVCTSAWNEQQDAGRLIATAEQELIDRFPDKIELIRAFYGRFGEMLNGAIAGTVEVLEGLHTSGVPLYALTNFSAETFPLALQRFDFLGRFRDIVVSGRTGTKKPDPAIFRLLLSRNSLAAPDCVFIDDSAANVQAARLLGFTAIRFQSPEQLAAELQSLGFLDPQVKNNPQG